MKKQTNIQKNKENIDVSEKKKIKKKQDV